MVCLVRWFHGGVVKENGEFENMKEVTQMFEVAPCLQEIVECARSHFSCRIDDEIGLKGHVDCGRGRAAYALVDLKTDVEWDQFKRLVEQASVPYLDVVVTSRRSAGTRVSQQEQLHTKGTELADDSDSETFSFDEIEPGTAHVYFPNDTFEREEAEEDDDDISEGSNGGDDNDGPESVGDELESDSAPPPANSHDVVPPPVPTNICPLQDDDTFMADGAHKCGSVTYTTRELDLLEQCHVEIPRVANDKDISHVDRAICETTLVHAEDEGFPQCETLEIKAKMKFDTFDDLKFFLADHGVRFHRPFTVVHSDKNERYEVMCKQGCMWHVWCRKVRGTEKWKITRFKQPHECRSSKPKQIHPQLTASYLGHRILGIVLKNNDESIPSLIESISPSVDTV
ncbi:hypothetical protein HU200_038502 [Digitaria exilis]|uniref:Transposase MuDR plant domain-containing protein n=1 Tax=Digitaria exilis TaxID=1010633 RepID=A0A835EKE7_9POAL|nr:hypothetical protein HU200_038502 [Digitaria exilis]